MRSRFFTDPLDTPDSWLNTAWDQVDTHAMPSTANNGGGASALVPVVPPTGQCKPFQEVLIELAGRLRLPAFVHADGTRKFNDYPDFIVNYEKLPGIGFLAGWRGKNGESHLRGEPNPRQWEKYIENQSFFAYPWPENMRYYRYANKDYLEFAEKHALFGTPPVPVIMQIYSEPLQKFRLAGRGDYAGPKPTSAVVEVVKPPPAVALHCSL